MISISHAPNATTRQRLQALGWLLLPWRWSQYRSETQVNALERQFAADHGGEAIAFSSGREALYAVLRAAGISEGHEVVIQAYTCIVVPHAVIWTGAKPVYADIDATLNIDIEGLASLCTAKTKAVIVQHTFGMPADMQKIQKFCKTHNLLLIEDAAHALGATYDNKPVGSFGDAAIFSFGRDKVISSTAGGMAVTRDKEMAVRLQHAQREASVLPLKTILQNLLHPILVPLCTSLIPVFGLGTFLMRVCQSLGLLNKVYSQDELASQAPAKLTRRLPEPMAALALSQYTQELPKFKAMRKAHAAVYSSWMREHHPNVAIQRDTEGGESAWLRYTIFVTNRETLLQQAKKRSILLGDWYRVPIMPNPKDVTKLGYTPGSCPKAEEAAAKSVNLPTYPRLSPDQRDRIFELLADLSL